MRNWAGNHQVQAGRIHLPTSVEELQDIVRGSPRVRALGSRHTFNDLPDADGDDADLVSLELLPRRAEVDATRSTVTVDGGARYGDVIPALDAAGLALENLASLPHISVAGACSTGTHGSGDANRALSSAVVGLELVGADGDRRWIRSSNGARSDAIDGIPLDGVVVGLGALGIVTALELRTVPAFEIAQTVYEEMDLAAFRASVHDITSLAYSASFFTSWRGRMEQVWLKQRPEDPPAPEDLFGARWAAVERHPIVEMSAAACTAQLGVAGPWHARLPHFRLDHVPSAGNELQSEYLVAREHLVAAFEALDALREDLAPLVQISEIRTVAADHDWLSMAFGRPSAAFHFTWLPDWPGVSAILPRVEAALAPFEARPHWGKLFTMPWPDVRARYPRLPDFALLVRAADPAGKFQNPFVRSLLDPPPP